MTAQAALATVRASLYSDDGQWLRCPSCEKTHPAWRYKRPFLRNPAYLEQTADIVKCPGCGWTFAPCTPPRSDHA